MVNEKKLAAGLSITSNAIIIIFKLIAGMISGSISIISEAIHSLSDFLASVLTFFAVIRSSEPADSGHQFGHGKYEDMSGFIEGGLIIFAGLYIIYEALNKLIFGYNEAFESTLGIYAMGFAVVANIVVSSYLFKVAKKTESISLYADAEHLRTDVLSSLGVLIALVIIKYTGLYFLDPVIAIIVAVIIMKAGYSISKETLNDLLDGSLPKEDLQSINEIIKNCNEVMGYANLRTRKSGNNKQLEVTLFFNPDMKLYDCHAICDKIEAQISSKVSNIKTVIHMEPVKSEMKLKV